MATYTQRMRALLVKARGCISDEMMAAGGEDVRSHPTLSEHKRTLGQINKFLDEPKPPVLTAKEKTVLSDAVRLILGLRLTGSVWSKQDVDVLRRVEAKLRKVLA